MKVLDGCHEGKHTPRLTEVVCPRCGGILEVFVNLGGGAGETGRLISDERCPGCGYEALSGTPISDFQLA